MNGRAQIEPLVALQYPEKQNGLYRYYLPVLASFDIANQEPLVYRINRSLLAAFCLSRQAAIYTNQPARQAQPGQELKLRTVLRTVGDSVGFFTDSKPSFNF